MSFVQLRTVPALFIGRRTVLQAAESIGAEGGYRCGECETAILPEADGASLEHAVVKCSCGAINQL